MLRKRLRQAWDRATVAAAPAAGAVVRFASLTGPSLAGAACVSYGLSQVYAPLGWIAAGAFALLADAKRTAERKAT